MRRSAKTSLFLLELIAALLLFAFCAAISVRMFAAANKRVQDAQDLTWAVRAANSAAEFYKAHPDDLDRLASALGGAVIGNAVSVSYDAEHKLTEYNSRFRLDVNLDGECSALIRVVRTSVDEPVYELQVKVVPR